VIDDLGSGLNYKKRGLKKLLKLILSGQVSKIVLTHKDRLLRFGSELLFQICNFFGTEVEVIEEQKIKSDEEVLAHDVLEIITVFSARMYGKRAHRNKK
jgi:predicted site-specific integrase-resolvase